MPYHIIPFQNAISHETFLYGHFGHFPIHTQLCPLMENFEIYAYGWVFEVKGGLYGQNPINKKKIKVFPPTLSNIFLIKSNIATLQKMKFLLHGPRLWCEWNTRIYLKPIWSWGSHRWYYTPHWERDLLKGQPLRVGCPRCPWKNGFLQENWRPLDLPTPRRNQFELQEIPIRRTCW